MQLCGTLCSLSEIPPSLRRQSRHPLTQVHLHTLFAKMYPGFGPLRWAKVLWVLVLWLMARLPCLRPAAPSFVNAVRYNSCLLFTTATHPILAPAVIQPSMSIGPAIHMIEGQDQGHQSDAPTSTVPLQNEPVQLLSPSPDLKSTTSRAGRRGRHSSALDQLGKEPETCEERSESESEIDDSPTGMYVPAFIHDKARGLRRRTK
jgi:hypothetical protein